MAASGTAWGRGQFPESMLVDIMGVPEGKAVVSSQVEKTDLFQVLWREGSVTRLSMATVAAVNSACSASILTSDDTQDLSAQLKWASTSNSSGASIILVSLLTVLRQFKIS